jgi:hypothetical protein
MMAWLRHEQAGLHGKIDETGIPTTRTESIVPMVAKRRGTWYLSDYGELPALLPNSKGSIQ